MNIHGVERRLVAIAVALLAVGCTEGNDPPLTATVIVEASASAAQPLLLTVSTSFDILDTGEFAYKTLESITITEDYTEVFALNSERRIVTKLLNEQGTEELARLVVLIDGRGRYDQTSVLSQDKFLQYLYTFRHFAPF